jgi:hypothetical protein
MKKFYLFLVSFLVVSFVLAQTVDQSVLQDLIKRLQNLMQTKTPTATLPTPTSVVPLPQGVAPLLPVEKSIIPEIIRPILPDEDRSDDVILQLNNLKIKGIWEKKFFPTDLPNPPKAIIYSVRDIDWRCFMFEKEEAPPLPCITDLRRAIYWREISIRISDQTILLLRNRQKAKLEDFEVGDKINVYGFMDKDDFVMDALIVRNLSKPVEGEGVCRSATFAATNPKTGNCYYFRNTCDLPSGWIKKDACPITPPITPKPPEKPTF